MFTLNLLAQEIERQQTLESLIKSFPVQLISIDNSKKILYKLIEKEKLLNLNCDPIIPYINNKLIVEYFKNLVNDENIYIDFYKLLKNLKIKINIYFKIIDNLQLPLLNIFLSNNELYIKRAQSDFYYKISKNILNYLKSKYDCEYHISAIIVKEYCYENDIDELEKNIIKFY